MSTATPSLDVLRVRTLSPELKAAVFERKVQLEPPASSSLPSQPPASLESQACVEGVSVENASELKAAECSAVAKQVSEQNTCSEEDVHVELVEAPVADVEVTPLPIAPEKRIEKLNTQAEQGTVPIAFPCIAIDRYGFLVSDKYVVVCLYRRSTQEISLVCS
jgi:hypothetical protein